MSMRPLAIALLSVVIPVTIIGCDQTSSAKEIKAAHKLQISETQRLYDWFDQNYKTEIARSPITLTYLGMTEDKTAYGKWDDVSDAALNENIARTRSQLDYLKTKVNRNFLTPEAQVSYDFAVFIAQNEINLDQYRNQNYVYTQFFGPYTDMTTTLIGYHSIASKADAMAYINRLKTFDEALNTYTKRADLRASLGVMPPSFAFPIIIDTAQGIITGAPFSNGPASPLMADFEAKVAKLPISEHERDTLKKEAQQALLENVGPAYDYLIKTMKKHQEKSDDRDGAWKLPDGEAFYQAQLNNYTTRTDLSAEVIHNLGLSEVQRIHGEMIAIMDQVGFEGDLQAFFEYLRTDPQFYYPNNDQGRKAYLNHATQVIDSLMERAPDYFNTLPKAKLAVRAVEPYRIETATGAFYEPGSLDGTRPGAYYVNMSNMTELPKYQLETLSYHEGAPGHHFQSSISQELKSAPMFQKLTWLSAYGEGWALYAEKLGKDMGFFTDPYQDFGRLSYEVFRAARLVVDTGIHHKKWTEQQANEYMLKVTPMTAGDIKNEVRRYIVWPGQAVSYKVGMLTILELRERAKNKLDDKFSYGDFHDVVLKNGSVPLTILEQQVDNYIAQTKAAK